jgi:steroid delta-isomerase-like uncharacterized protein
MAEARELGERWFDTMKTGDTQAIAALLTDDVDFYSPGGQVDGPQEVAQFVGAFATAVLDSEFDIRIWVESGSTAVAEGTYRGTHTGPMMTPQGEIPATGKSIDLPFVTVFEARDGKISAHRAYWDNATFSMQLGLMPAPGA